MKSAVRENKAANRALRSYLADHEDDPGLMVERMISDEHPWDVLASGSAVESRAGYVAALRRFEDSRREIRLVTILWAKRVHGLSYRSMGPRIGVSEQMAVRLGREAAQRYPD